MCWDIEYPAILLADMRTSVFNKALIVRCWMILNWQVDLNQHNVENKLNRTYK